MIVEARIVLPDHWDVGLGQLEPGGEVLFPPTGVVGRILHAHVDARGAETVMVLTLEIDDDSTAGKEIREGQLKGLSF